MKQDAEQFEELVIPRRELNNLSDMRYRVYSNAAQFDIIDAVSALDALQKSGMAKAYKIERHNPLADNVLHLSEVQKLLANHKDEQGEAPMIAAAPKAEPVAQAVAESTQETVYISPPPEAATLSNDEVSKLLNG